MNNKALSPSTANFWPPLIVASRTPKWVKWRDVILTFLMWFAFAIMLQTEFELFVSRQLVRLGLGNYRFDWNWAEHFERLMPFVFIAVTLIAFLSAASIATLRRRRVTLLLSQPLLLEDANQAARAGLPVAELAAARDLKVAVVHFDPEGRYHVDARETTNLG
jgi:hypothetical protein